MYKEKKILAVIPARGGSKRLPGKNIKILGDKPLIAWTIDAANNSKYIDKLILSSDDVDIIRVAKEYGCDVPFVRPAELATDTATSEDVLRHAITSLNERYDYVLLLQPTSPFRTSEDIDNITKKCIDTRVPSVISMTYALEKPQWMCILNDDETYMPACEVSDISKTTYIYNGALYIVNVDNFLRTKLLEFQSSIVYLMPSDRSIDVDTLEDFMFAEFLFSNNRRARYNGT